VRKVGKELLRPVFGPPQDVPPKCQSILVEEKGNSDGSRTSATNRASSLALSGRWDKTIGDIGELYDKVLAGRRGERIKGRYKFNSQMQCSSAVVTILGDDCYKSMIRIIK